MTCHVSHSLDLIMTWKNGLDEGCHVEYIMIAAVMTCHVECIIIAAYRQRIHAPDEWHESWRSEPKPLFDWCRCIDEPFKMPKFDVWDDKEYEDCVNEVENKPWYDWDWGELNYRLV